MSRVPQIVSSFLLFSAAAHSETARVARPSETCEALPSTANPLKPIKDLNPIRGTALRRLVVGSVMTTPYGRQLWDSSTYYGSDGRFSRSVHRGEVGGTYRFRGGFVRERTDDPDSQETSFALYQRKDGIIVAHFIYHYQGDEVRNYCVSFDRPTTH